MYPALPCSLENCLRRLKWLIKRVSKEKELTCVRNLQGEITKELHNVGERLEREKEISSRYRSMDWESLKKEIFLKNWKLSVAKINYLTKEIIPFDIQKIINKLVGLYDEFNIMRNQELVMLFGARGCGKSTTAHFLLNSKLTYSLEGTKTNFNATSNSFYPLLLEKFKISSSSISGTKRIVAYKIDPYFIGFDEAPFVFCETPGFDYNTTATASFVNATSMIIALKQCKSMRPIFLFNDSLLGSRMDEFKGNIDFIDKLMNDSFSDFKLFTYLFVDFSEEEVGYLHSRISEVQKQYLNNGFVRKSDICRSIMEQLLSKNLENFVNPIQGKSLALWKNIFGKESIKVTEKQFQSSLPHSTESSILDQIKKHEITISTALKVEEFDLAFQKIKEVEILNEYTDDQEDLVKKFDRKCKHIVKEYTDCFLKDFEKRLFENSFHKNGKEEILKALRISQALENLLERPLGSSACLEVTKICEKFLAARANNFKLHILNFCKNRWNTTKHDKERYFSFYYDLNSLLLEFGLEEVAHSSLESCFDLVLNYLENKCMKNFQKALKRSEITSQDFNTSLLKSEEAKLKYTFLYVNLLKKLKKESKDLAESLLEKQLNSMICYKYKQIEAIINKDDLSQSEILFGFLEMIKVLNLKYTHLVNSNKIEEDIILLLKKRTEIRINSIQSLYGGKIEKLFSESYKQHTQLQLYKKAFDIIGCYYPNEICVEKLLGIMLSNISKCLESILMFRGNNTCDISKQAVNKLNKATTKAADLLDLFQGSSWIRDLSKNHFNDALDDLKSNIIETITELKAKVEDIQAPFLREGINKSHIMGLIECLYITRGCQIFKQRFSETKILIEQIESLISLKCLEFEETMFTRYKKSEDLNVKFRLDFFEKFELFEVLLTKLINIDKIFEGLYRNLENKKLELMKNISEFVQSKITKLNCFWTIFFDSWDFRNKLLDYDVEKLIEYEKNLNFLLDEMLWVKKTINVPLNDKKLQYIPDFIEAPLYVLNSHFCKYEKELNYFFSEIQLESYANQYLWAEANIELWIANIIGNHDIQLFPRIQEEFAGFCNFLEQKTKDLINNIDHFTSVEIKNIFESLKKINSSFFQSRKRYKGVSIVMGCHEKFKTCCRQQALRLCNIFDTTKKKELNKLDADDFLIEIKETASKFYKLSGLTEYVDIPKVDLKITEIRRMVMDKFKVELENIHNCFENYYFKEGDKYLDRLYKWDLAFEELGISRYQEEGNRTEAQESNNCNMNFDLTSNSVNTHFLAVRADKYEAVKSLFAEIEHFNLIDDPYRLLNNQTPVNRKIIEENLLTCLRAEMKKLKGFRVNDVNSSIRALEKGLIKLKSCDIYDSCYYLLKSFENEMKSTEQEKEEHLVELMDVGNYHDFIRVSEGECSRNDTIMYKSRNLINQKKFQLIKKLKEGNELVEIYKDAVNFIKAFSDNNFDIKLVYLTNIFKESEKEFILKSIAVVGQACISKEYAQMTNYLIKLEKFIEISSDNIKENTFVIIWTLKQNVLEYLDREGGCIDPEIAKELRSAFILDKINHIFQLCFKIIFKDGGKVYYSQREEFNEKIKWLIKADRKQYYQKFLEGFYEQVQIKKENFIRLLGIKEGFKQNWDEVELLLDILINHAESSDMIEALRKEIERYLHFYLKSSSSAEIPEPIELNNLKLITQKSKFSIVLFPNIREFLSAPIQLV